MNENKMAMTVTKKAMKQMENMALDMARQAIMDCAEVYGFSAEEAMERLGANQVSIRTEIVTKKEKKEKVEKAAFPLPFSGYISETCCQGVKPNRGLYTQCEKKCNADGEFCKGCAKQAAKNANGQPDCGIIANRANPEWRDAKGKAPVAFVKVMKKLKLTEEQVLAEVARLGVVFDAETHFAAEPPKESKRGRPKKAITSDTESSSGEKKSRGRPKKAAKIVEVSATEDLFATLVQEAKAAPSASASAEAMSDLSGSESESESVSSSKKSKNKKMTAEEKAAKDLAKAQEKAAKEAAKAEEKAAKEAAKAEEKAAKELAKAEEKAAKELAKLQEKEAKEAAKAEEKAAKELAKAQEKAAKDLAKAEEKAAKEQAKAQKPVKAPKAETKVVAKVAAKVAAGDAELEEEEEDEEEEDEEEEAPAVAVSKFEFQGKTYLKSSNNVIYDLESQDEIGVWNATKNEIEFQEYETDSDDE